MTENFDYKLFFDEQMKMVEKLLAEHGFRYIKARRLFWRVTNREIIQMLNIQSSMFNGPESRRFVINFNAWPLYSHLIDFKRVYPGMRFGFIFRGKDFWWDYTDAKTGKASFEDVDKSLSEELLPWFEERSSLIKIKDKMEKYMADNKMVIDAAYRKGLDWYSSHVIGLYILFGELNKVTEYIKSLKCPEKNDLVGVPVLEILKQIEGGQDLSTIVKVLKDNTQANLLCFDRKLARKVRRA